VLWIAREPVLWHSVGIFCATFIYSLGAIAWVQHDDVTTKPYFSGWLAVLLLLASVAMFIALIEKISLLQIYRMLAFTGDHGRRVIAETYPALEVAASGVEPAAFAHLPVAQTLRHVGAPRSLQALDVGALVALASAAGALIEVASAVGDTLVE